MKTIKRTICLLLVWMLVAAGIEGIQVKAAGNREICISPVYHDERGKTATAVYRQAKCQRIYMDIFGRKDSFRLKKRGCKGKESGNGCYYRNEGK